MESAPETETLSSETAISMAIVALTNTVRNLAPDAQATER